MSVFMIVIALLYAFAAVSDIRTMEVPLWVAPSCVAVRVVEMVYTGMSWGVCKQYLFTGIVMGCAFLIIAFVTDLGGADALFIGVDGFVLGWYGMAASVIGLALPIPMLIVWKVKKKEHPYPLVPFLFAGFMICLLLSTM